AIDVRALRLLGMLPRVGTSMAKFGSILLVIALAAAGCKSDSKKHRVDSGVADGGLLDASLPPPCQRDAVKPYPHYNSSADGSVPNGYSTCRSDADSQGTCVSDTRALCLLPDPDAGSRDGGLADAGSATDSGVATDGGVGEDGGTSDAGTKNKSRSLLRERPV